MFRPTPVCFGARCVIAPALLFPICWLYCRRLPLTSKQGHNFYKGNRVGALGRHTRRGTYQIDYNRVRTYVVPYNLKTSNVRPSLQPSLMIQLSPFVPRLLPPVKSRYPEARGSSGFGPHAYLRAWNRSDRFPKTPGKTALLEARYNAARLSVAPTLFTKSNPPPTGKIVVVDRKKARKMRKQRIKRRKAAKKARRRKLKLEKKRLPVVL